MNTRMVNTEVALVIFVMALSGLLDASYWGHVNDDCVSESIAKSDGRYIKVHGCSYSCVTRHPP